jgi:Predicted membrane protein (DUF2142)
VTAVDEEAELETTSDDEALPESSRRIPPHVVGLIGIVMAFVAIGALFAFEQPPFVEADETAHVAYAHAIADLHLPRIDERIFPPASASIWRAEWASRRDDRYRGAWVANHPPLNYVLSAPAIWVSNWTGRPDGGLLFLRLQNVSLAAVGVALTYFVGLELSRGNRRIGLLSAAVAALVPQGVTLFSHGMNDGLGFAAGSGLVWATLRCCRRPATRRDLALLSGFAIVAFGSRAATMLLAVMLVGIASAWCLFRPGSAGSRVRRAVVTGVVGLGPATVAFGWFYLRNQIVYGDIGASSFVLEYFRRRSAGSIPHIISLGRVWLFMYRRMTSAAPLDWHVPRFATLFAVLSVAGLVLALLTRRRGWWRGGILIGVGAVALTALTVAQHIAGGGNWYPRYFFPVLGVLACLAVLGLDRLLPRILPLVAVVAMACWLMTKMPISVDPTEITRPRDGSRPTPILLQVLPTGDGPRRFAAVLLVLGGIAAVYGLVAETLKERRAVQGSNHSPIGTPGSDHTSSASLPSIVGSSSGANT